MDKARALAALRDSVAADLAVLAAGTADARDAATSGEAKSENKYDTRATEASYLAAGQGERLAQLRALAAWLAEQDGSPRTVVGPGALAWMDRDGRAEWVLFGPQGGQRAVVDGVGVLLLSADSPLGEALGGLRAGESEEIDSPRGTQVVWVRSVG